MKHKIFGMGSSFTLPLQEPLWFSYYGPIRHTEASNALDAAIASHLQEIGASSGIPIRKEVAEPIVVQVALDNPPFKYVDETHFQIMFSATAPGKVILQGESSTECFDFNGELNLNQIFRKPAGDELVLTFDFDRIDGVSSRIYTLGTKGTTVPYILDDKIVLDGVPTSIARVFKQQNNEDGDDDGFNDGMCLICCSEMANVIVYPCRHCCMCRSCSERFATMSSHCPVCRAVVQELIEIEQESDSF